MNKYFSRLYFPDPTLDVADVLTSVGVSVAIGNHTVAWAYSLGQFGGDLEQLDATPLISKVKINKSGLEDREAWTVEYYHNDDDYAALAALKTAGTSQAIVVTLPDGATFTNNGVVTGNYMTDVTVNSMLADKVTVDLSGEWAYTAGT
jgi:hypothetical protein